MLIFAINLNVKKDDKKIDQLKSPLINQNIPKNPIRLFQKNEIVELQMTGEKKTCSEKQLTNMIELSKQ